MEMQSTVLWGKPMAAVLDIDGGVGGCLAQDCVSALHARFRRPLQRFFASFRLSADDVEDLTQEVFLRLTRSCRSIALRQPESFVFALARNLVRDHARRLCTRCARVSVAIDDMELPCCRPTPEQTLEQQDRLRSAQTALQSLKPCTREAFVMHRLHGHSYTYIAAAMGVSVSMIEKHVMAAMAALRSVNE